MKRFLLFCCFFSFFTKITAQVYEDGTPVGLTESFLENHGTLEAAVKVPLYNRSLFERVKLKHPNVVLDAAGVDTRINMINNGEWTLLNDGSRVWRVKISTEGASTLTLLYDDFFLPKGSKFYLYTEDESQILGAFTHHDNQPGGKFSTATIFNHSVILEYNEPAHVETAPRIRVSKVLQGMPRGRSQGEFGFGASSECHENINCVQEERFEKTRRGVVRIVMFLEGEEGTFLGYCTGTLMNNTAQDQTPYLLTAFHCLVEGFEPLYDQWQFHFNYESTTCQMPGTEPTPQVMVGAEMVAGRQDPDFLLLKIKNPIPSSFNPYFCGWNRADGVLPVQGAMISHPCGDIKKVSIDGNNTATIASSTINWESYTSSPNTHFQIKFDYGFSQLGASGAPLIGNEGLVFGQLHGGSINLNNCEVLNLFYGRLNASWETNSNTPSMQLKNWLDPLNTGVSSLGGLEPNQGTAAFSGTILTGEGEGVAGVLIQITGADTSTIVATDTNGMFFAELPRNSGYELLFDKNINYFNGISTFDLVKIRQHILGIEEFANPLQLVAADVNLSNSISTFDMIQIQKIILGIDEAFTEAPSWGFISPEGTLFNRLRLDDIQPVVNLNFAAVKMGDVNFSANPEE